MNQLIEVKKGTSVQNATMVATFGYDPIGRRILKSTPTKTVAYTYDGADILRENVTTSGSTVTSYYVHGPGIDEPLSKETGSSVTYYHADGLGSIAKETDGSGVVTNTLRYDAWGNIETGARDGFAFTGREWDPETGLYYYRARYYDPGAGRFINEDSWRFYAGANFFTYVGGRPTVLRDPTGHNPIAALIGGIVGAAVNVNANVGAYIAGRITLGQYAGSIAIGAGSGAVGALLPGVFPGIAVGTLTGVVNDLYQQTLEQACWRPDWARTGRAFGLGIAGGAFGALFGQWGSKIVMPGDELGSLVGSNAPDYGDWAGVGAGTLAAIILQ